jgi:hypothetical protein
MAELIDNGRTDIAIGPRPTCTEAHVEVFVHYDPDNGMAVWVDQLAADHGIVPRAAHAQPADRRSTRRCRDGRNDRPGLGVGAASDWGCQAITPSGQARRDRCGGRTFGQTGAAVCG